MLWYTDNQTTTVESARSLYESAVSPVDWVVVEGLLPFADYVVQVNASNSRGYVLSNAETATTPPDSQSCTSTSYL